MACEAVQMWSLSGLVAAFLDLAVAFLVLCASAVVYFASKFLGFCGLNLPCPCDGMFTNVPNKALCFNRLLIDFPIQKVSDVQLFVKQRIPFSYSECPKEYGYSISGGNCVNGILEIEGAASCSSVGVVRSGKEKYDIKGKGVLNRRAGSRLRCRRGIVGDATLLVDDAGTHDLEYDNKALEKKRGRERAVTSVEMNESNDEDVHIKKSMQFIKELQDNQQEFQSVGGDDKNTIRLLEQKLKEEHIARAALYIELEKERSAAATAADEAMAMILRLQEEKASIEIEARQYQRILEEKSVYDAEEMSILKEIIVRREMEKHFLEKEVEAYRQAVSVGSSQSAGEGSEKNDEQFSFNKNRDLNENSEDVGFQEKEIIIANWNNQMTSPLYPEQVQETNQAYKIDEKIIETCNGNHDRSLKKQENDSCDPIIDKEPHVYDLHIIGDQNSVPRSSLEISGGVPPVGKIRRGLSTSAMDSEMLKIDSEIGRLRERLKLVQEGREKLGLNRERENVQLTLLEEIARQVQEIRRLTEPGNAARHVSLPLPTSKVLSKKRRSRSVSSGL